MEALREAIKKLDLEESSYSLRLALSIIKSVRKQFPDVKIQTEIVNPVSFTCTGVRLSFNGTDWTISIQTETKVAGPAFCESALLNKKGLAYEGELGYGDVIRHHDPQDLRAHLVDMFKRLPTFKSTEKSSTKESSE